MAQDTDYGTELTDAANDQLGEMGREVTESTAHRPLDTDFSAAILRLRQADCDLIVLGTIIGDTILAISAARAIDWDVEFVGPIATFESEVAEAEGGVTNGFYAMTSFEFPYADHPRQEVRDFVAITRNATARSPTPARCSAGCSPTSRSGLCATPGRTSRSTRWSPRLSR